MQRIWLAGVGGLVQNYKVTNIFAGKSSPSDEKLRGGYYTPEPLARFVADWVSQAGQRLLEPSCGDGSILKFLAKHGDVTGIELIPAEAKLARERTGVPVVEGDFFTWFTPEHHGQFDGVAGNPPYIRFGSWEERYREPAFALMRSEGLCPTRLTNAWLPFVVGSVAAVRDGGRIGLVIPAELLQVGYAAQLRAYLVDSCSEVTVVSFKELVFPGILQEVLLLLATKGRGPASIRTLEIQNGEHLDDVTLDGTLAQAPLHESEKWTKYFLSADQIETLRDLRKNGRLSKLGKFAKVNVGVVTGRNAFFCMTLQESRQRGIYEQTISLLSRSAQFSGVSLTESDISAQSDLGANTRLLALEPDHDVGKDQDLLRYISLGEADGVHEGYKCRIRKSWWSVPSISQPSGFMLRQISKYLRLIDNGAEATSTDTVHRVFAMAGVDMRKLSVAALNSATLTMSEVLGRSYGGGLLEIEPTEAVSLPIPDPSMVGEELINEVDVLLRSGEIEDAIRLVDQRLMVEVLGFQEEELALFRDAGDRLRQRRLGRGKRANQRQ